MSSAIIKFILGAIATFLIIDITLHLVYRIHGHFERNRLIDEYTDVSSMKSPPIFVRAIGLVVSIILNLIIYYFI